MQKANKVFVMICLAAIFSFTELYAMAVQIITYTLIEQSLCCWLLLNRAKMFQFLSESLIRDHIAIIWPDLPFAAFTGPDY